MSGSRTFFNLSLHTPSRGVAFVSGMPCHPPEPFSGCCYSCGGGHSTRAQPPLSLTAPHFSGVPSCLPISALEFLMFRDSPPGHPQPGAFSSSRLQPSTLEKSVPWRSCLHEAPVAGRGGLSNAPFTWLFHLLCLILPVPHSCFQGPPPKKLPTPLSLSQPLLLEEPQIRPVAILQMR